MAALPAAPTTARRVLHVDMDAFFAAVEQHDRPELRGKPVLVGGSSRERGVVATASYEARPFGPRSAMPMAQAVRLCPDAIVVPVRMHRYREVSQQVFRVFDEFTPLVQPVSVDEAYLDVTGCEALFGPAEEIARRLKARVREETQLTASVGVAPNRFLAKLASDLEKPDGLVVIPAEGVQELLDPLPLGRIWGIGRATLQRFERLGAHRVVDVRRLSSDTLARHFGSAGEHFYRLARGIDDSPVVPEREAKSISAEVTFPADVRDREALRRVILHQLDDVCLRLRRHELFARTVSLKIRYPDFTTITRSETLSDATQRTDELWACAARIFDAWAAAERRPVRLIGAGVSHLQREPQRQLSLFGEEQSQRSERLDATVDALKSRFGNDAVRRGGPG